MKLSCREGEPGYVEWATKHRRSLVFLDGVRQRDAIRCDEEAGTLTRYKRDADGKLVLNRMLDEIETEDLTGVVRIEPFAVEA